MPLKIHAIPSNPKVLGAYAAPDFSTLKPFSKLLIYIIFKASKASVARSNRAGQAKIAETI